MIYTKFIISFFIFGLLSAQRSNASKSFETEMSSKSAIQIIFNDTINIKHAISNYQSDIEYALSWRSIAIKKYKELSEKKVLSAADMNYLNYAISQYKKMRFSLYQIIERYAPLTNESVLLRLNDSSPSFFKKKNSFSLFGKNQYHEILSINPNDQNGQEVIKKIKIGLVFALLLYDNYLVAVAPYEKNNKLRFLINETGVDPDNRGYLNKISESYSNLEKMERMIRAIKFIYDEIKWEGKNSESKLAVNDAENDYLNILLSGSLSYRDIVQMDEDALSPTFKINRFNIITNKYSDRIIKISQNATGIVSRMLGNSAGMIVVRRGKMESLSNQDRVKIISQLQPMDILLEKAPFRLTDYLIPGYWSHIGVWVGNETDLKTIGVWNELPLIYQEAKLRYEYTGVDFQASIRAGHSIIEALRPGVQMNTFNNFLNIDDFSVVRFKNQTLEQTKLYVLNAFKQIGKDYDFNFNVESTEEIVCSELIYMTFEDLSWDTQKYFGRYTISPDLVVQKIKSDKRFQPIILFLDGNPVVDGIDIVFSSLTEN